MEGHTIPSTVAKEFGCELFGPTASAVYAVFAVSAVCGVVRGHRGHRGTAIHGSSEAVRAVCCAAYATAIQAAVEGHKPEGIPGCTTSVSQSSSVVEAVGHKPEGIGEATAIQAEGFGCTGVGCEFGCELFGSSEAVRAVCAVRATGPTASAVCAVSAVSAVWGTASSEATVEGHTIPSTVAQEIGCELFGPTASAVYAVFAVSAVCRVVRGHHPGPRRHGQRLDLPRLREPQLVSARLLQRAAQEVPDSSGC